MKLKESDGQEADEVNQEVDFRDKGRNQSVNTVFVERRYTARPGAPTIASGKHDQKYTFVSFTECTGISNVVKVGTLELNLPSSISSQCGAHQTWCLLKNVIYNDQLLQLMMISVAGRNVMDFDVHVSSGFIYWADFASVAVKRREPTHVSAAVRKVNVRRIKPDGADYADVIAVSAHMNSTAALAINWVTGMMPRCSRVFELKIILAFAY